MEVPKWRAPDGRALYESETQRHHIASERKWYKTPTERKYREMNGMVLRLAIQSHRELHANVPPPPKPGPDFMRDIYVHSRNIEYDDQYDLFRQITEFVGVAATEGRPKRQEEAIPLYDNFVAQGAYIELGRLTLIRNSNGI